MESKENIVKGNKYEILENTKSENAFRIRALRDFGDVQKGDIGGFVQSEENLSQEGDCWIYGNSYVLDNARVEGDAKVRGRSCLFGNACVCEYEDVSNVFMKESAKIKGNVCLDADVTIGGNALIADENDICYFGCFGEDCQTVTAYRLKYGTVEMTYQNYQGSLEGFKKLIKEVYPKGSPMRKTFKAILKAIKYKFCAENE